MGNRSLSVPVGSIEMFPFLNSNIKSLARYRVSSYEVTTGANQLLLWMTQLLQWQMGECAMHLPADCLQIWF